MVYGLHIFNSGMQCENSQLINGVFHFPGVLSSECHQCIVTESFHIHAGCKAFFQFFMLFQETVDLTLGILQDNNDSLILLLQGFIQGVHRSIVHFRCLADNKRSVLQLG